MKRIVILGAAESGVGSAILAQQQGFCVFVSDSGTVAQKYQTELNQADIQFEQNGHTESEVLNADLIIKSPGIADSAYIIKKAKQKSIPVVSEIEFAVKYTDAFIIAITGSNGKTTTTLLTYHILKQAGFDVAVAGNVGYSFARLVANKKHKYFVLELSSFQLDGCNTFSPDIAVLLNITPDHLDRYDFDFQKYIESKFRITQNLNKTQKLIYCFDDQIIRNEVEKKQLAMKATLLPFSLQISSGMNGFSHNNQLVIDIYNNKMYIDKKNIAIQGKHNQYNTLAASIAARAIDIRKESIRQSLETFEGVEHRLEHFATKDDVSYINDSKATNVNSTWYALETIDTKIIWIAGGVDKGNDYQILADIVNEKVKALICLGKDNQKLINAFGGSIAVFETTSMQDAVEKARELAQPNETVLLSPACASFDLFSNYIDRGNKFKEYVYQL